MIWYFLKNYSQFKLDILVNNNFLSPEITEKLIADKYSQKLKREALCFQSRKIIIICLLNSFPLQIDCHFKNNTIQESAEGWDERRNEE